MKTLCSALVASCLFILPAKADMAADHQKMMQQMMNGGVSETGQSAFAAIAEIVAKLEADPKTDWSKVNIAALQQHLADMDLVTLHSIAEARNVAGGAVFTVKGEDARGIAAIQHIMLEHAPFLASETGFTVTAEKTEDGAQWTVISATPNAQEEIRGLGFYGLLATGGHHQMHHLAIATGKMMH